jgi:D-lactate dehydrogenase (cytochrome)
MPILTLGEQPTLFLEFHGTAASTREQVESFAEIARSEGGGDFRWAERPEERTKLWQARHDAYWAARGFRPGADVVTTDVCVPISALAACVGETHADIESTGLLAPIVGHVGDGNFHVTFIIDPDQPAELEEAKRLNDRMVMRALALGGTCTGEHGIGYGKLDFLTAEHGDAVAVMRQLKMALDPQNIMNPGKILRL